MSGGKKTSLENDGDRGENISAELEVSGSQFPQTCGIIHVGNEPCVRTGPLAGACSHAGQTEARYAHRAKPVSEMERSGIERHGVSERCEARERDGAEGGIERHGVRVSAKPVSEMERKAESSATASASGAKPVSEMERKAESSATACERCEARERDGAKREVRDETAAGEIF